MLSADGVSRYSEQHNAQFATPKARLFRSLKYGNVSSSASLLSVSDHDRMSSTSLQLNRTPSLPSPAAVTCLSPQFVPLSPKLNAASVCSVPKDNVQSLTSGVDFTDKLPETTEDGCPENSFLSGRNDTCLAGDSSFHRPSTPQQR